MMEPNLENSHFLPFYFQLKLYCISLNSIFNNIKRITENKIVYKILKSGNYIRNL